MSVPLNIFFFYTWNARLFQSTFIQKGTATIQKNF